MQYFELGMAAADMAVEGSMAVVEGWGTEDIESGVVVDSKVVGGPDRRMGVLSTLSHRN